MNIVYTDELSRTPDRLKRHDHALFRQVQKKICQISLLDESAIEHFKNLRGEMSGFRRVHIGCFVLTFDINGDTITFRRFAHHDGAYTR